MIKITRFFYIHWLVLPLFLLSHFTGGFYTLLTAYAVVSIHEIFHLLAALLVHERVGSIIVMPFGMTLRLSASLIKSTGKEMFIAACGPLANVLMLMLCPFLSRLYHNNSMALLLFRYINYGTLIINLLPCLPLDGGRILKALLTQKAGYIAAASFMRRLSRIITIILFLVGLFLLMITRMNISLLMVACFLALHMAEEQRQNEYIIMQELLYNKNKLKQKGALRSRLITAMDNMPARDIFKMLSYDSYYLIVIVDSEQKKLRTITEAQLVSAISEKGWRIFLSQV